MPRPKNSTYCIWGVFEDYTGGTYIPRALHVTESTLVKMFWLAVFTTWKDKNGGFCSKLKSISAGRDNAA